MKPTIEVDLTEYVWVQLTDHGRAVHKETYKKVWSIFSDTPNPLLEYTPPKEDEDGWSRWQLWVLMQEFGKVICHGGDEPFRLTIRIETKANPNE